MNTIERKRVRPRVLLIDDTGSKRLEQLLAWTCDVVCADNMRSAKESLDRGHVDLIVCSSSFCAAEMFDLLATAQGMSLETGAPFVCVRQPNQFSSHMNQSVEMTARRLGALQMIDCEPLNDWELLAAIEEFLPCAAAETAA